MGNSNNNNNSNSNSNNNNIHNNNNSSSSSSSKTKRCCWTSCNSSCTAMCHRHWPHQQQIQTMATPVVLLFNYLPVRPAFCPSTCHHSQTQPPNNQAFSNSS